MNRELKINGIRFLIFNNPQTLAEELSIKIKKQIKKILTVQPTISMLLSGGISSKPVYKMLAQNKNIPWKKIHIFWSDERFISLDSQDSNYKIAYNVFLSKINIPGVNIHQIKTNFATKEEVAGEYEKELRIFFKNKIPNWDINILGIGEDCHTASLFPHSSSLQETEKWVIGVDRQKPPPEGITMTLPVLNNSKYIYMLVTGENKAEALCKIFKSNASLHDCPAKRIRPISGNIEWWVDTAAARLL